LSRYGRKAVHGVTFVIGITVTGTLLYLTINWIGEELPIAQKGQVIHEMNREFGWRTLAAFLIT
jgi:hypothetical protein